MTFKTTAVVCGALAAFIAQDVAARTEPLGTTATPPGITVSPPRSIDMGGRRQTKNLLSSVLSDADGMTLYVRDADADAKATACAAECLKAWPPVAAPARAAADGEWSVFTRIDGFKQWAYKGKPLYRSVKDTKPGEANGDGADGAWHMAMYELPGRGLLTPAGITVKPNARAAADIFVDFRGMTLYTQAEARNNCDTTCQQSWAPLAAGELSKPVGEWSVIDHEDGSRQWAYKTRAVYTFRGDGRSGEANGLLADARWQALAVHRYFMPAQVQLRKNGSVLTFTTANGITLYARDRYQYAPGSFHADEGGLSNIAIGREIGTAACDAACTNDWTPFKPAADAQPSGYWSIVTRADGTRQWAYQGYALYTNAKDKKPGEMLGSDVFDFTDGSHAMYWRVAAP